jgi:lysophospholipase L1-like esterase
MKRLRHAFKRRARHKPAHRTARRGRHALMTLALLSLGAFSAAQAQTSAAAGSSMSSRSGGERDRGRLALWKESFEAFEAADRVNAPKPGGVLFVGSSSIRLWDSLEEDFRALPVVTKRGFGGSRLSDCSDHMSKLVLPYKPRLVVVYAGENDLAEGATPQEVLASFVRFVEGVRKDLPETRIAYVSIKPSPSRAALIEQARAANALIEAYSASTPNLDYIDVFSKMLGADGQPRPELFVADMLHLNRAGYALWRNEISARLDASADPRGGTSAPATLAAAAAPRAAP